VGERNLSLLTQIDGNALALCLLVIVMNIKAWQVLLVVTRFLTFTYYVYYGVQGMTNSTRNLFYLFLIFI
jgi:hypothetical protein